MTIEQKAKAYDEAIEKFRPIYNLAKEQGRDIDVEEFEKIFPELKESEDEKIRREIIFFLKNSDGQTIPINQYNSWLAWLEKQGEQKESLTQQEAMDIAVAKCFKQDEQEVKPKFKVGDWVTNGVDCTFQITSIKNGIYYYYHANECGRDIESTDNSYHLWTIQDAKDGDVLMWDNGRYTVIFKEIKDNKIIVYCSYNNHNKHFGMSSLYDTTFDADLKFVPATKEQRDQLFKAIADAGYEWNAELLEQLKKL